MTDLIGAFMDVSGKMLDYLRQSAEAEAEKRRVLLDHDMERLESLLQEQQAITMQLEILEKKRVEAQRAAGFSGMKPAEILASVQDLGRREELAALFQDMRLAADNLQELNRSSMEIVKMELRIMGSAAPGNGTKEGLYTAGGKKGDGRGMGSSFNGKI